MKNKEIKFLAFPKKKIDKEINKITSNYAILYPPHVSPVFAL